MRKGHGLPVGINGARGSVRQLQATGGGVIVGVVGRKLQAAAIENDAVCERPRLAQGAVCSGVFRHIELNKPAAHGCRARVGIGSAKREDIGAALDEGAGAADCIAVGAGVIIEIVFQNAVVGDAAGIGNRAVLNLQGAAADRRHAGVAAAGGQDKRPSAQFREPQGVRAAIRVRNRRIVSKSPPRVRSVQPKDCP